MAENETEIDIRFDDVSDPIPPPEVLVRYADALRERMGEWALIGSSCTSGAAGQRAYAIRRGDQAGFGPPETFEAQARTLFGEHRVYARYVGPS